MHSRLKGERFQDEISKDNSPGSATLPNIGYTTDWKKECVPKDSDISSPDIFPLKRNTSPSYSISDKGMLMNTQHDFETEYLFLTSSSRTNSNQLHQEHNISSNSAEPQICVKNVRCYKLGNSTPLDPSKISPFTSYSIEGTSTVTADSQVKERFNSDTLIENNLQDRYPVASHQMSNIYSSTFNTDPNQFSFETSSPELLSTVPTEINLSCSHSRRKFVSNEETDQSFSKYLTAEDLKSPSTDSDKSSFNDKSTFIEENEKSNHKSPNIVENSLNSEYGKFHFITEYPFVNKLQTKQNINLDNSFSSNCDSVLAQFDSSDEQLDDLRREFGLESISDKDFVGCDLYDNIYEELSSILNDDFQPEKTENCSSPTPETASKIKQSPISTFELKTHTESGNPNEKSFTSITGAIIDLPFSTDSMSTKEYVPYKKTDNKCIFSSDIGHGSKSITSTVSNRMENWSNSAGFHPGKDEHHTESYKGKNICFSNTVGCGGANESDGYNTVAGSLFSNFSYTKTYNIESAANESTCKKVQFSEVTKSGDRYNRDGTSNTVESLLFPTASVVEKHTTKTASEANRKRERVSYDVLHEDASNYFDSASKRLKYGKQSKFDDSIFEKEINTSEKVAFSNNKDDSNMCCEVLKTDDNQTTFFENRNTEVSDAKPSLKNKTPEDKSETVSHLMRTQNLVTDQNNINIGEIHHESSYDVSHAAFQKENKPCLYFKRNLNENVPFSSDISSQKNTLKGNVSDSTTYDAALIDLKSNLMKREQTLDEPKNNLTSSSKISDAQNLQLFGLPARNICEANPRLENCVKVKIEPISDSFEMKDLSFAACLSNNGLNSDAQNIRNMPANMNIKLEDVRVKQEDLSADSQTIKTKETSHTFHASETNSYLNNSFTNSQNCVHENMETNDSSHTMPNNSNSSKDSSRSQGSKSYEERSMYKICSIPSNVITPLQLKELYDIDKNVAKAVLGAINDSGMKNGLNQTQILKYIKQHKNVPLHPKLNQDVCRFLKSASEVGIIKKNGLKFSLSDKVKCMAAETNKSKKPPPKTQNKCAAAIASVMRQMETVKRNSQEPIYSPKQLRSKIARPKVPTLKVFKTLRSRVVLQNSD